MMAKSPRSGILLLVFGLFFSHLASAQQVWGQGGLGTVFVGLDSANRAIYKKYYLVAVGPEADDIEEDREAYRRCTRDSVVSLVKNKPELWNDLSRISTRSEAMLELARNGQGINGQALRNFQAKASADVRDLLVSLRATFYARLKACKGFPAQRVQGVRFGIVKRICTKETCRSTPQLHPDAGSEPAQRYEKLDEFVREAGILSVNEAMQIDAAGSLSDLPFRKDSGNSEANVGADDKWPVEPTTEEAQKMFERGVVLLRKWNARYASIAPMAAGVSRDTARRVLDVIEHPAIAIPRLRSLSPPDAKALLVITDEIAQSRIRQCISYQGKDTVKEIGKCAGYDLDETALLNCLSSKSCIPEYDDQALLNAAEVVAPTTLARLADTSVARILPPSAMDWDKYRQIARDCVKNSADAPHATLCLTRASLPPDFSPEELAMFDCATHAASGGSFGRGTSSRCLLSHLPEGSARAVGECLKSNSGFQQVLECSALSAVKGKHPVLASCLEQGLDGKAAGADCFAELGGKQAAMIAECRNDHGDDVGALSVCYFEKNGDLPNGSTEALRCAEKNDGSATGFTQCMGTQLLGDKIPGELGTAVRCAAQSGGSTVGTLACMAGPNVRPEQQIALECLSQSADATSYAVCVGGRLTLRELQNCKHIDYGDPGCYGDNNEIRRFLGALGINTDKGTVVGDVLAFHVKVAATELVFAETGLKTAAHTGEKGLRLAESVGNGIADGVHGMGGAAGDVINGVAGGVNGLLHDTLGGLGL
jgi:hypothetical protein